MKLQHLLIVAVPLALPALAADLPVREVILYKHGVGYFQRSGDVGPGETVKLGFKASDMNDVLKSLTVTDRGGGKIAGVRYDAAESAEKRLQDFPFALRSGASLSSFLDQMKGARLELRIGPDTVAGSIIGARTITVGSPASVEREMVVLLADSGEIRNFDLSAATSVKFTDPKLQEQLRDYLAVLSGARSRDRRNVYIDAQGTGTREIVASYMTPAAVWKSAYRLIFGTRQGQTENQPMLEGWAIVDNTTGEDWNNVNLSVVSGRPISFVSQLYEPRYVTRPTAELTESRPVGPVVLEGALQSAAADQVARANMPGPPPPAAKAAARAEAVGSLGGFATANRVAESTIAAAAEGRDLGELFEYSFATPVSVKQGESAMLPFLQQRVNARKLLIYSESYGLHPMNAAEITNSSGKTLDGGPITVYDDNAYAGEALVETVKAGDKRLISYGVDLGTRVSTAFDSAAAVVRELHYSRGILTTRNAIQETKTYTIKNVDANAKTVIVEHPLRQGYKLIDLKSWETTSNAYRFEVKVAANSTAAFPVREERVFDQTISVSSLTPDVIATWAQNKSLSEAGRRQLEQIAAKKREIASAAEQLRQTQAALKTLTEDQDRLRRNIDSLRNFAGQQETVQQYARQLSANEAKFAALRDQESQLRKQQFALESELNGLLEKAEF
jgi:hypothetical protein